MTGILKDRHAYMQYHFTTIFYAFSYIEKGRPSLQIYYSW